MGECLVNMGKEGFAQESPQQLQPLVPGGLGASWVAVREFGRGMDASNCPQLHPAAFGSVWRHRAHPRTPPLPLGKATRQWLPVIDVLWVITADNEIFNHHLYYQGSSEPGGKPLLFGQGCADEFGADFGAGRARWSLCGGQWIEVVVVAATLCP